MKKTASIILSFIMLGLFISAIPAQAKGTYDCGDYYIDMIDGAIGDCIITAYCGTETNVIIPTRINNGGLVIGTPREINDRSFAECSFLISVTIPDTVNLINYYAFEYCTSLEKVVIPPSVKEIHEEAFRGCNKLTIYGYINTAAERYAKEYSVPFKSMGVYTEPTTPSTTKTPVSTIKTTAKTTAKVKTIPTVTTKKATIKKLTPKKKALKVAWKKVSGAEGYEIKLATNKKFTKDKRTVKVKKGSATSKTIKKLKSGKKYYVKIRAYKNVTIDGYTVTANGAWSKVKSKKVK